MREGAALFADLYELTMLQAYVAERMTDPAVFELFFRKLPEQRNYLIAAGLEDALDAIERLEFTDSDIAYLRGLGFFSEEFLDHLRGFRFGGDVDAAPEGEVIFAHEPVMRVRAPLGQAQVLETLALNEINIQTMLASKAARVVDAARGRTVVDFGARRAHGVDAAMKAARCAYLAGCAGTSLLSAGRRYDIPVFGTMAHSYVQAHQRESEALESFAGLYPNTTLLVDTYDTLEGVRRVIELTRGSREAGRALEVRAVRLDSGDLAELAASARRMLDDAGLEQVRIFASGSLDEHRIARLVKEGAPIDGFGVGTKLTAAADAPYLDCAYKLVEYAGEPRVKLSSRKATYPGPKQVFREWEDGRMSRDRIGRADERLPGRPLLEPVMRGGRRLPAGRRSIQDIRSGLREHVDQLPTRLRDLEKADPPYPVQISRELEAELETLRSGHR